MKIVVSTQAFDPWKELQQYQEAHLVAGSYGATAVFVGTMRDFNQGESVRAMTLEHYPGMTERHLAKIAEQATQQWQLLDVFVVHRVGKLLPDQPIVLVAVWSKHRADAFEASRFIMEALKSQAPFWKKEATDHGDQWVKQNTPGYTSMPSESVE